MGNTYPELALLLFLLLLLILLLYQRDQLHHLLLLPVQVSFSHCMSVSLRSCLGVSDVFFINNNSSCLSND